MPLSASSFAPRTRPSRPRSPSSDGVKAYHWRRLMTCNDCERESIHDFDSVDCQHLFQAGYEIGCGGQPVVRSMLWDAPGRQNLGLPAAASQPGTSQ